MQLTNWHWRISYRWTQKQSVQWYVRIRECYHVGKKPWQTFRILILLLERIIQYPELPPFYAPGFPCIHNILLQSDCTQAPKCLCSKIQWHVRGDLSDVTLSATKFAFSRRGRSTLIASKTHGRCQLFIIPLRKVNRSRTSAAEISLGCSSDHALMVIINTFVELKNFWLNLEIIAVKLWVFCSPCRNVFCSSASTSSFAACSSNPS